MLVAETISDFISLVALFGLFSFFDALLMVSVGVLALGKVIVKHFFKIWVPESLDSTIRGSLNREIQGYPDNPAMPSLIGDIVLFPSGFPALAVIASFDVVVTILYVIGTIERELYILIFMLIRFPTRWIQLPRTAEEASRRSYCLSDHVYRMVDGKDDKIDAVTASVVFDADSVKAAITGTCYSESFLWKFYYLPRSRNKADIVRAYLKTKNRAMISYGRSVVVLNFDGWNHLRESKRNVKLWVLHALRIYMEPGDITANALRTSIGPRDLAAKPIELITKGGEDLWRDRKIRVLFESDHEVENQSSTDKYRYSLNADETARLCRNILKSHYSLDDVMTADRIIVNRWMRMLRYISIPIIYILTQAAWTGSDDGAFDISINQENLAFKAFQLALITLWLNLGFPRLVGNEFTTVERADFDNLPSETRDKIILAMSCRRFKHLMDRSTGWWTARPDLLHYKAAEIRKPILGMSTYDFVLAGIVREEGEGSTSISEEGDQLIKVKHIMSGREAYIFKDKQYFEVAQVLDEQPESAGPERQVPDDIE